MAWTEQCKLSFEASVTGLVNIKGYRVRQAIKQIAEESGISTRTLWYWWSEVNSKKKETVSKMNAVFDAANNCTSNEAVENTDENLKEDSSTRDIPQFVCRSCKRIGVKPKLGGMLADGTRMPVGPKSKYFGLCVTCARQIDRVGSRDPEKSYKEICPHCGNDVYITWDRIKQLAARYKIEKGDCNG